ncbi:16S rRNA (uracil(1498)-N(3))-methyltransferase [Roseospira visakhapatnamensis]|uniref:Ribosomal RNA small subunit methyltransferase E n=1 Tax=Roseospira visakhapatnamensis TaxID=390880 RepID=A0A7W6RHF5_9PROT|nr:16S rRNA (uracil(1498)-N(3))-methyltransferase [Roseospira visakhapatnamensis]MBB4267943.1 16S rRNA (uracil1498-N3)-methyltransferase [Roseospira visakhapatnamensis]
MTTPDPDPAAAARGQGPRLYVPDAPLDGHATVDLPAAQSHYLRSVMRRGPGNAVVVFNGRDGEWRATVERLAKAGGRLLCRDRLRPQAAEAGPWLLFAPLKRGPVDLVAEKATELGVARLEPVLTRFTASTRVNTDRLRALAVEAAEQCRRLTVPEVAAPVALARIAETWPAERRLLVLAEHGDATPAARAFAEAAGAPAALLVGPEGGLADSELDALRQLDFVTMVRLGPRILRAETAAIAGLSLWQTLSGDWR